jgi:hypothetical protein
VSGRVLSGGAFSGNSLSASSTMFAAPELVALADPSALEAALKLGATEVVDAGGLDELAPDVALAARLEAPLLTSMLNGCSDGCALFATRGFGGTVELASVVLTNVDASAEFGDAGDAETCGADTRSESERIADAVRDEAI